VASTTPEPEDGTIPIVWDVNGSLTGDDACGTSGVFRPYDDCADATPLGLPCTEWDAALSGPEGQPGFSVSGGKACGRGTVRRVIDGPDGTEAYSAMWGAKVSLDFSGPGGEHPFDAAACGVRGFRFDLERRGDLSDLRVRLRSGAESSPFAFVTYLLPARRAELVFERLDDGQDDPGPPPVPEAIHSLSFEVYTNTSAPKSFDFCVSNLRLLPNVAR
jgi:hypothetical protein